MQRIIEQIRAYSKHKRRPPLPNPVLAEQVSERKDLWTAVLLGLARLGLNVKSEAL